MGQPGFKMKQTISNYWWLAAAILVLGAWLWTLLMYNPIPKTPVSFQDYWLWRGTFGDMFGAANCLFSAFVVIGVVYGIVQQREELREARNSAAVQRFDAQFFYLIDKIETNRQKMKFEKWTGRDAISAICERLNQEEARQHASLYLMNIWNILKIIDLQPNADRQDYIHILTGCLSVPEFRLLFDYTATRPKSELTKLVRTYYPTKQVEL